MRRTAIFTALLILINVVTLAQSIDVKLDRLTSLSLDKKDYVTNEQSALMGDIINYILDIKHDGVYQAYYVPYKFQTVGYQHKTIFYNAANINMSKKLFYWCYKEKDDWIINSQIIDSLNNTSADYRLYVIENDRKPIYLFQSTEACYLTISPFDKWHRINHDFDSRASYTHVYLDCQIVEGIRLCGSKTTQNLNQIGSETDSLLKLMRVGDLESEERLKIWDQLESITEQHERESDGSETVYLTKVYSGDINFDENIDFYWCAISNGQIVYYSALTIQENDLITKLDKLDLNHLIQNNQEIADLIRISKE